MPPLFADHSAPSLAHAQLAHKFPPLPRLTPLPTADPANTTERYEVLTVGAGPAGAFLNLLLARFGLPASSRLCIDSRAESLKTGRADGIVTRTLEVLKSLGIADEILNHGSKIRDLGHWKVHVDEKEKGIQREKKAWGPGVRGRWPLASSVIHQGWVEKVLEDDLKKYSPERGIQRGTSLMSVKLDEEGDVEYPIVAELEENGHVRSVRAKYLVGADGAHSAVRKSLDIAMEGNSLDDLFGVIDLVVDTDFPDIRRMVNIEDESGTILLIPREKNLKGEYLNRFYVPFAENVPNPEVVGAGAEQDTETVKAEIDLHARKAGVTAEAILARVVQMMKPYQIRQKHGTEIEWWAAYQIGQRLAERIVEKNSAGSPRVFLIGDASHTHSPKTGQGMNVSMMDALDLAWKLTHVIHGLAADPGALLNSFVIDRAQNAANLIDLDKAWYANRYLREGRKNQAAPTKEFVTQEMWDFILGYGVEYDPGYLVDERTSGPDHRVTIKSGNSGALREGRRFPDAIVIRFADDDVRHMQDEVVIDGKYHVLMFLGTDVLAKEGVSIPSLNGLVGHMLSRYEPGTVSVHIIQPFHPSEISWTDLPEGVKEKAEMDTFYGSEQVYEFYGVDREKGALVVVRPDQFVGSIGALGDVGQIEAYLDRILVKV